MFPKTRASRLLHSSMKGRFGKSLKNGREAKSESQNIKERWNNHQLFLLAGKKGRENSHLWLDINLEPGWTLIKSEHRILLLAYKFTRGLVFPGAKFPAKWLYVPRNSPYLLSVNTLNVKKSCPILLGLASSFSPFFGTSAYYFGTQGNRSQCILGWNIPRLYISNRINTTRSPFE